MPGALYGLLGTIVPPWVAYPELAVALWSALEAKDLDRALRAQTKINQLQAALRPLGRIYGRAVQCETVRARGFAVKKFPRWTTKPLTPEHRRILVEALAQAGLSVSV